ncbi:unnamed protein product [Ranitomeya imitator]|uniref:Neurotransmitter-gated ion-channel ligand-binding domain-containing protein n=1 Tax=Ranitomeya imitator TaxID=111125 RepID=A0ABN9LD76_9NEOB|nr:unnamed protein product [Ranitomeya imitator]
MEIICYLLGPCVAAPLVPPLMPISYLVDQTYCKQERGCNSTENEDLVDNHMQLLTSYVWFAMTWKNEFINWDPEAFCNIEFFFYSSDNLWTPDNYILEMTEADSKNPVTPFYQISYDGFISAAKPIRIVSSCNLNIFYYPFDTQTCNITFGPYISDDVNFISEVNSSYLYEQTQKVFFSIGEWNLINLNVSDIGNRAQYQVCGGSLLKGTPQFKSLLLSSQFCFLVILDIIGMFIHLRDTERLMFKITVVLGFAFLLVVLNQILSTSESPPLLKYCTQDLEERLFSSILGTIRI